MAKKPISFERLVDLGPGIDEAIKDIQKLEKNSIKIGKNLEKQWERTFKVFQDGISRFKEINTALSQQNPAIESNRSNIKKLGEEVIALDKTQVNLTKSMEGNKRTQEALTGTIVDLKEETKKLQKEYNETVTAKNKDAAASQELATRIRKLKSETSTLAKETKAVRNEFDLVEGSYDALVARNKKLSAELRRLPDGFDKTSKRAKELKKELADNTQKLKDFDEEIGRSFRNVGNYGSALDNAKGALGNLTGGLLVGGGIIAGAAAGLGILASKVEEVGKQLGAVRKLTGLAGRDLQRLTANIRATSSVFDKDFNEVLRASNVLIETFGLTGQESIDLVNEALIRGVDINDDFLDQISEYSEQFRAAGLEANDLVNVLIKGEDAGIFNDKAADAVKEAAIRIRELTPATADALKGLGLNVEEIRKGLADGSLEIFDVIKQVSEGLNNVSETSSVAGTAIADIFGGPGEDAGIKFLKTLKDIEASADDYTDSLSEAQKATKDYLDSQVAVDEALVKFSATFETSSNTVKTFFNNIIADGIVFIGKLIEGFQNAETVISNFKKTIAGTEDVEALTKELEELTEQQQLFIQLAEKQADGDPVKLDAILSDIPALDKVNGKIEAIQARLDELRDEAAEVDVPTGGGGTTPTGGGTGVDPEEAARKRREAFRKLQEFRIQENIRALQKISQDEDASLQLRIGALEELAQARVDLAALTREGELDQGRQLLASEKQLIEERFNAAKTAAEDQLQEGFELVIKPVFEGTDDLDFSSGILQERLAQNEIAADIALTELNNAFANEEISLLEFEQRKLDIQKQFQDQSLKDQLAFLNNQLAVLDLTAEQRTAIQQKIADVELAISQDAAADQLEVERMKQEAIQALKEEAIFTGIELANIAFENEIARAEERLERLEEQEQAELDLAGENEEARAEITKKFAEEKKKAERDVAKAKRKQAIFDKAVTAGGIIVDTAKSVAGAVAAFPLTGGLPFSAINAAIGALQLATVLAQPLPPLPSFATGTKSAPGGPSIVGEKGPELVREGSKYSLTPGKPTLVDLPKGAEVMDAITTQRMMSDPEFLGDSGLASGYNRGNNAMANAEKMKSEAFYKAVSSQKIDYSKLGKAVAANLPAHQEIIFGDDGIARTFTVHPNGSRTEHRNKEKPIIGSKNAIFGTIKEMQNRLRNLGENSDY